MRCENGVAGARTVIASQIGPGTSRSPTNVLGGRPKRTSTIAVSPIPARIACARARIAGVPPRTCAGPEPRVTSGTTGEEAAAGSSVTSGLDPDAPVHAARAATAATGSTFIPSFSRMQM
jgi:hypothetical protein